MDLRVNAGPAAKERLVDNSYDVLQCSNIDIAALQLVQCADCCKSIRASAHILPRLMWTSANAKLVEAVRASVAAMLCIGESHYWQLRVPAQATLNRARQRKIMPGGDVVASANR
jgi:hypothetical protein